MIATLTQIGDDLALILKPELLEQLGIDRESRLEVTTDGRGLYLRPIAFAPDEDVIRSVERMMDIHDETFRKLAE